MTAPEPTRDGALRVDSLSDGSEDGAEPARDDASEAASDATRTTESPSAAAGGYDSNDDEVVELDRPENGEATVEATVELLDGASTTTLARTYERKLETEIRAILHGDVLQVPEFVGDLVTYFESGVSDTRHMTPREVSMSIGERAMRVLNILFEVTSETTPSQEPEEVRLLDQSPVVATRLDRAFDVFVGATIVTRAWKLPALLGALAIAPARDWVYVLLIGLTWAIEVDVVARTAMALLVDLAVCVSALCVHATAPSALQQTRLVAVACAVGRVLV